MTAWQLKCANGKDIEQTSTMMPTNITTSMLDLCLQKGAKTMSKGSQNGAKATKHHNFVKPKERMPEMMPTLYAEIIIPSEVPPAHFQKGMGLWTYAALFNNKGKHSFA